MKETGRGARLPELSKLPDGRAFMSPFRRGAMRRLVCVFLAYGLLASLAVGQAATTARESLAGTTTGGGANTLATDVAREGVSQRTGLEETPRKQPKPTPATNLPVATVPAETVSKTTELDDVSEPVRAKASALTEAGLKPEPVVEAIKPIQPSEPVSAAPEPAPESPPRTLPEDMPLKARQSGQLSEAEQRVQAVDTTATQAIMTARAVSSDQGATDAPEVELTQEAISTSTDQRPLIQSPARQSRPVPPKSIPTARIGTGVVVALCVVVALLAVVLAWVAFVQVKIWNSWRAHLSHHGTESVPAASPSEEVANPSEPAIATSGPADGPSETEAPLADGQTGLPKYQLVTEDTEEEADPSRPAVVATEGESQERPTAFDDITPQKPDSGTDAELGPVSQPPVAEASGPPLSAVEPEEPAATLAAGASTDVAPQSAPVDAPPPPGPVPGPPAVDPATLIEEAKRQQRPHLEEDLQEQEKAGMALETWNRRLSDLKEAVHAAVGACGTIISKARQAESSFPDDVRSRLHGRQDGLDLIEKMLRRLAERVPPPAEIQEKKLLGFDADEMEALVARERSLNTARKKVDSKLKLLANERYQHVDQLRSAAEKSRKSFLSFVEKQVLPILDGVDDGERSSVELITELRASKPEAADILDSWFRCYASTRTVLLNMVKEVGVCLMLVERGEATDYARHEPFEVEPDPEIENEHIKSVTRNGYEVDDGDEKLVLRPAQVIVVKN